MIELVAEGKHVKVLNDGKPVEDVQSISWQYNAKDGTTEASFTVAAVTVSIDLDETGKWQPTLLRVAGEETEQQDETPAGISQGDWYAVSPFDAHKGYIKFPSPLEWTGATYKAWMESLQKPTRDPERDSELLLFYWRQLSAIGKIHMTDVNAKKFDSIKFNVLRWMRDVTKEYVGEALRRNRWLLRPTTTE